MAAAQDHRPPAHWPQEIAAGTVGTLTTLAVPLTLGLLAFATLGGSAATIGIPAALTTVIVGGIVYGLLGRAAMPVAGPSSATALILAGLVATLAGPGHAPADAVVAAAAVAVLLSGGVQLLLALLGLARLARFVPQPVLAGFMNGVALLIVIGQLPLLLGHVAGTPLMQALRDWQPLALLLGAGTAALAFGIGSRWPRLPASLLALAAGTAVHLVLQQLRPDLGLGQTVGALPAALPGVAALQPLLEPASRALLQQHASLIAVTALVLGLVGALESVLNTLAIDQQCGTRHDPGRELLSLGLANIVCGAIGGLPAIALRARATAVLLAGGRGAVAAVGGSIALGVLLPVASPALGWLPLPVLAGIMLVVAIGLADRWAHGLLQRWWSGERSRDIRRSLALVVLVCGVTIWKGFVAAVAVGVLLATVIFITRMNRSLLRSRSTAAARPSRRAYPAAVEARLQPLRERVLLLELEGALFFGNVERLLSEADALGSTAWRSVVLDLHRVGSIDETGVMALQQLQARLRQDGIGLRVAGLGSDSPSARALAAFGGSGSVEFWPDIDRAVEAAERELLGDEAAVLAPVALADCPLLLGLDAADQAQLLQRMPVQRLRAGELLFAEGDAADRLYVLVAGSLSVVSAPQAGVVQQRYLSLSPGMMLGEMAMLDGQGRSAAAVADGDAVVHVLHRADIESLQAEHPQLSSQLYRNIAVHLSQRLRSSAAAWHASTR